MGRKTAPVTIKYIVPRIPAPHNSAFPLEQARMEEKGGKGAHSELLLFLANEKKRSKHK